MRWSQASEVGLVRQRNEDHVLMAPDLGLFAVADGMGGHRAGEVASRMALGILEEFFRKDAGQDISQVLSDGVTEANSSVYNASLKEASCHGMGTTLTALVVREHYAVLAHVGDSRAYLIRGDDIIQLTRDHSLVQELYREGGITRAQAREHPQRNVLTRALGTAGSVDIDLTRVEIQRGDLLLLCTDGLSNLVEDHDILMLVRQSRNPEKAVTSLIRAALSQGGNDNISVVLVEL